MNRWLTRMHWAVRSPVWLVALIMQLPLCLAASAGVPTTGLADLLELDLGLGVLKSERAGNADSTTRVILSPAEKVRRDVRVEYAVPAKGPSLRLLFEFPARSDVDEVNTLFTNQLDGTILFRCSGRDCGRSNVWANDIWGEPLLYGAGHTQRYRVVRQRDAAGGVRLIALYVVQRGNRRVYAQIVAIAPTSELPITTERELLATLTSTGHALLEGIAPGPGGTLSSFGMSRLEELGGQLGGLIGLTVYVVCHTASAQSDIALFAAAENCATDAAARLQAGHDAAQSDIEIAEQTNRTRNRAVRFEPFAAGPLLPRAGAPRARLELVIPERLWRD